jgi:aminoglycoside phosphotransferase (APT) family kinase protein
VLAAAGVADRAAAECAVATDVSRSHATTLLTLPDGAAYVVKRVSAAAGDSGRSLAAELYAYRMATWQPELAAVLPEPVLLDERRQVLALVAAPVEHLFATRAPQQAAPGPDLAAAMGVALATVHAVTLGAPIPTVASCGVLRLPDTPEADRYVGGSATALAVARAVAADDVLAAVLRRGARLLRPCCLVHGDVKWDNAVLDSGPPARVALFDWELSGLGDPAWDVGSALADCLALAVRLSTSPSPVTAVGMTPAMTAVVNAYGRTARSRSAGALRGPDMAERIVCAWTARTVHLAMECAAAVEDADHPAVRGLLVAARALVAENGALTAAVARELACTA